MLPTSIRSQTTLPTDSRQVTYEKLSEFAKYVAFKQEAEPLLASYEREVQFADSLMDVMREKYGVAKDDIRILTAVNDSKDLRLANGFEILKVTKNAFAKELKSESKRKWNWGAFGIIIGTAVGFLTAISL